MSNPGYMSPRNHTTPRLPKLSYRNKISDAESIHTVSTDASRMTSSTNLTSPMESTFCPSPKDPTAEMVSHKPPQSPSIASSSVASKPSKNTCRKRPNFFSGLFGAKEPSAQAFDDYQKRLLKQGSGRTGAAAIPGVSSAKLPPTVPKVNSKWDGVPETLKERENKKQESGQWRGPSMIRSAGSESGLCTSTSQGRLSRGTLGGVSAHSSSSGTNRLADLYGWEVNSPSCSSSSSAIVNFAAEHRPTTSRLQTSHSAPAPLDRPPPLDSTFSFPPHVPSPQPASRQPLFEQSTPSLSGSPNVPSYSHSPALTPCESSPVTPDAPSPEPNFASPQSGISPSDNIKTTVLERPAFVDDVIIKSTGSNILGPPATAKRKAKVLPCPAGDDRPKTSGLDMPLCSILRKETTKGAPPGPGSDSYFPSTSPTPPAAPVQRNSARERLGLGMSMNRQAIAPWSCTDIQDENIMGNGQPMRKNSKVSIFRK